MSLFCVSAIACPQDVDIIKVGVTSAEEAKSIVDSHKGLPSRISYTVVRDGERIVPNLEIAVYIATEYCYLMIEVDPKTDLVSHIQFAHNVPPSEDRVFDIQSADQFVFTFIHVKKVVTVGDKLAPVLENFEKSWTERFVDGAYWHHGKCVDLIADEQGERIIEITVNAKNVESYEYKALQPAFQDRLRSNEEKTAGEK